MYTLMYGNYWCFLFIFLISGSQEGIYVAGIVRDSTHQTLALRRLQLISAEENLVRTNENLETGIIVEYESESFSGKVRVHQAINSPIVFCSRHTCVIQDKSDFFDPKGYYCLLMSNFARKVCPFNDMLLHGSLRQLVHNGEQKRIVSSLYAMWIANNVYFNTELMFAVVSLADGLTPV